MREPLLERDPEVEDVSLQVLVGVATAIEGESAQRYAMLEEHMRRRGDAATAAAFRAMCDEERAHMDAVEHWAHGLGETTPDGTRFTWLLPRELATSWEDVSGSATLTPYRAFAIAAVNEQRAFALYSYLSAHAAEPAVATQAERLALEELRHAALMRRWRRKAWHRDRSGLQQAPQNVSTVRELEALLTAHKGRIAERHAEIAAELHAVGDEQAAVLLEALAGAAPSTSNRATQSHLAVPGDAAVALLVAAQEPLEIMSERLEALMRTAEGPLFDTAETALGDTVKQMARIGLEIERRMQGS